MFYNAGQRWCCFTLCKYLLCCFCFILQYLHRLQFFGFICGFVISIFSLFFLSVFSFLEKVATVSCFIKETTTYNILKRRKDKTTKTSLVLFTEVPVSSFYKFAPISPTGIDLRLVPSYLLNWYQPITSLFYFITSLWVYQKSKTHMHRNNILRFVTQTHFLFYEVLIANKKCSSKRPKESANFVNIFHLKSLRVSNEM